jgi:ribonuclease HII
MKKYYNTDGIEAGIDEAGRGCLAGPVVAAAVVLPKNYEIEFENEIIDSKKLSLKKRIKLRKSIEDNSIAYAVSFIDNRIIDKINILKATFQAMHSSLELIYSSFNRIIVDGNAFPLYTNPNGDAIPHTCIINGDNNYISIAAASILAKTYRDEYIDNLCNKYPILDEYYNWKKNKCYGTKTHRESMIKYGITPFHRLSYKTCDNLNIINDDIFFEKPGNFFKINTVLNLECYSFPNNQLENLY